VEISLSPLQTEDGLLVSSAIRDIIDRLRVLASLQEKETLLQEIHHRVKNNLQVVSSLLKLQSDRATDAVTREVLKDSKARVRSIALLHEKLYQSRSLARLEMDDYIRELSTGLARSYAGIGDGAQVSVTSSAPGVAFGIDTALPCGLIINELVTNAIKHAFSGRAKGAVHVELTTRDEEIRLVVTDDGCGISSDLDTANAPTLGLRLVRMLAGQLGGTAVFDGSAGTRCTVVWRHP